MGFAQFYGRTRQSIASSQFMGSEFPLHRESNKRGHLFLPSIYDGIVLIAEAVQFVSFLAVAASILPNDFILLGL